jgi:hypothetical protein
MPPEPLHTQHALSQSRVIEVIERSRKTSWHSSDRQGFRRQKPYWSWSGLPRSHNNTSRLMILSFTFPAIAREEIRKP